MAFDKELLGSDEEVVLHLRTHPKVLIVPLLVFLLVCVGVGLGIAFLPDAWSPWSWAALAVVALVIVAGVVLRPYLNWRSSTYTITDRRIITRTGIITHTGHDLPLRRINDVTYERSLSDRILGCGSMQIQTASERGVPMVLPDVPNVEQVHRVLADLVYREQ